MSLKHTLRELKTTELQKYPKSKTFTSQFDNEKSFLRLSKRMEHEHGMEKEAKKDGKR